MHKSTAYDIEWTLTKMCSKKKKKECRKQFGKDKRKKGKELMVVEYLQQFQVYYLT